MIHDKLSPLRLLMYSISAALKKFICNENVKIRKKYLYWTFHNLDTKSHKILIVTQCKILLWISIIKLIIFPSSYNSSIMPSIKYFYIFYHSISLAILLLSSSTIGTSSSNASCNSL